jgi:hypothetical protein
MKQLARPYAPHFCEVGLACPELFAAKDMPAVEELLKGKKV